MIFIDFSNGSQLLSEEKDVNLGIEIICECFDRVREYFRFENDLILKYFLEKDTDSTVKT
jgi:hypothetical protein